MVMLRVPYPLGFFAKGLDGRIDDPGAGWKGRGLWSTNGDRTPWLKEGGKGSKPRVVHIQVRPIRWRAETHTRRDGGPAPCAATLRIRCVRPG